MFIQKPQIATVPKKQLIIILSYLGKISQIVKTILTTTMTKHMKFCKLRVIFLRLKTTFASNTLFLKHCSQILFINFCAGAAQPPTLVRHFDILK